MLSHYIARDIFMFFLHQFNFSPGIGLLAIVSARRCCYFRFLSAKLFPTEKKINKIEVVSQKRLIVCLSVCLHFTPIRDEAQINIMTSQGIRKQLEVEAIEIV
jgi:hypothetical protein